jgi:hypothetical protein
VAVHEKDSIGRDGRENVLLKMKLLQNPRRIRLRAGKQFHIFSLDPAEKYLRFCSPMIAGPHPLPDSIGGQRLS